MRHFTRFWSKTHEMIWFKPVHKLVGQRIGAKSRSGILSHPVQYRLVYRYPSGTLCVDAAAAAQGPARARAAARGHVERCCTSVCSWLLLIRVPLDARSTSEDLETGTSLRTGMVPRYRAVRSLVLASWTYRTGLPVSPLYYSQHSPCIPSSALVGPRGPDIQDKTTGKTAIPYSA